jgi:hypothetical protein
LTADYGALLPLPSAPTLDPKAVASAELDALYEWSAPKITQPAESDDSFLSCGCPVRSGAGGGDSTGTSRPVQVSQPVTIGPVTALTLTADTGDAINAWLGDNGFVIPAASQSIVDAYAAISR